MVSYITRILRFGSKGEKTGWTYIEIPADVAGKLFPGNKKSFRVKGKLDDHAINKVALLPMGKGAFIMPLNGDLRKAIGKRAGAMLAVRLELDKSPLLLDKDFVQCLKEEPEAKSFFEELPRSHQNYYSKWIASAKSPATKAKRIAQSINGFLKKQGFNEMLRANRAARQ